MSHLRFRMSYSGRVFGFDGKPDRLTSVCIMKNALVQSYAGYLSVQIFYTYQDML